MSEPRLAASDPPVAAPPPPREEAPFFAWLRRLDVTRDRAWLAGVCGGIAARLNIDPLIVRGIFLVVALVGFPALLVYALAWALLPDAEGRIHLQELGRGRFDPALVAIAIMGLLSFFPSMQWVWSAVFWPVTGTVDPYGLVNAWNGVLIFLTVLAGTALAIWLIVWLVRYPDGARRRAIGVTASAEDEIVPDVAPVEPVRPAPDADGDAMEDWRRVHDRWRIDHEEWRRRQTAADAAARDREREERLAAARAFAAESAKRRGIRRASNPRASAVFVLVVLGAALVAGALSALAVADPTIAPSIGLLVAGVVVATGMVLAGALRRRSGLLAFVAVGTLLAGYIAGFAGVVPTILPSTAGIYSVGSDEQRYLQPFGTVEIDLFDATAVDTSASGTAATSFRTGAIDVRKGSGETVIRVARGVAVELDATLNRGTVEVARVDPDSGRILATATLSPAAGSSYREELSAQGDIGVSTIVPVRIVQSEGSLQIVIEEQGDGND